VSNILQLRRFGREIFDEALRAVDARAGVRRAVRLEGSALHICDIETRNGRIYSIAVGKAAQAMGSALKEVLGESLVGGVFVSGPRTRFSTGEQDWSLHSALYRIASGHPLPNKRSLYAA